MAAAARGPEPDRSTDPQVDEGEHVIPPITDPVGTARRRHGTAGAILAAGMFGVDIALGRKPKEDAPVVVAASDEPIDLDRDGLVVPVDDTTSVLVPAQPRSHPRTPRRRPATRHRRR